MIIKNSDWELGAYLYEYNGDPITGVSRTNPITLLSETFFQNFTKAYINKKFFYFDLSKDTYFLKCNVNFILRFYIRLRTELNNSILSLTGYYTNPLQLKLKTIPELSVNVTANTPYNYRTINNLSQLPDSIIDKDNSFFIGVTSSSTDTITFFNDLDGFYWSLLLRQI